jgi:hypothetical protein
MVLLSDAEERGVAVVMSIVVSNTAPLGLCYPYAAIIPIA